ncbi:hypothetical protein Tco_1332983 [Tanacetum coccineum]
MSFSQYLHRSECEKEEGGPHPNVTVVNELVSFKEELLLIWGDTYLVFDLVLNVVNCVGAFNFENDGLTSEGLDQYRHRSDVMIKEGSVIIPGNVIKTEIAIAKLLYQFRVIHERYESAHD